MHFFIRRSLAVILSLAFLVASGYNASAYSVLDLTATCRNGQVFLVWENPPATNLQYNVYRSTVPFTSADQLTSFNYLGFVRDNSSRNLQLAGPLNSIIFYRIDSAGLPLLSTQGLYAVTCTDDQSYYYTVTVTTLSNSTEEKSIVDGENTMSSPVVEKVGAPQPVYQYSEAWSVGQKVDRYTQFVNNQETSWYHAMNSTGSYGFNFYILKRGSAKKYPLIVVYEGLMENSLRGNGLGEFENMSITNCYILGVDDWLPTPNGTAIGVGTNWCGYHENFNIYSNTNPVPTTGTVKLYTQERIIASIRWSKHHFPIDTSKVYTVGVSAGGNGAMLTAHLIPDEIAAVYAMVQPFSIGKTLSPLAYQMWGSITSNLRTDFLNWKTGVALNTYSVLDHFALMSIDEERNFPLLFDLHGKKDQTILWTQYVINWFDSLESNHIGGVSYWDQRGHDGIGANFLDSEITPEFTRYTTTKSFPAFSYCSINQEPGDGSPASGDAYGAINDYLEWKDNITDKDCDYTLNIFMKDFYVGGILYPGGNSTCITDITFRRLQNFQPEIGAKITWKNVNSDNVKIQSGSLIYDGKPITIKGIIVNKSGNKIKLKIANCVQRVVQGIESPATVQELLPSLKCYPNPSNGLFTIDLLTDDAPYTTGRVEVLNSLQQIIYKEDAVLINGRLTKELDISSFSGSGIYIVKVIAGAKIYSAKVMVHE